MLSKTTVLLLVVCCAHAMAGVPYVGGPGGPGGVPSGDPMPGGPGGIPGGDVIPGGVGQCIVDFTPLHVQVANFAVSQMGSQYTLRRIQGIRSQVVAGTMYHLDLHVAKNTALNYCENCDVRVWQQLDGTLVFDGHNRPCYEICCH